MILKLFCVVYSVLDSHGVLPRNLVTFWKHYGARIRDVQCTMLNFITFQNILEICIPQCLNNNWRFNETFLLLECMSKNSLTMKVGHILKRQFVQSSLSDWGLGARKYRYWWPLKSTGCLQLIIQWIWCWTNFHNGHVIYVMDIQISSQAKFWSVCFAKFSFPFFIGCMVHSELNDRQNIYIILVLHLMQIGTIKET